MAQPNPAPLPDERSQPAFRPAPAEPQSAPLQPLAEPKRSPEVQAEVDRIRSSDTYLNVARELRLFAWLNEQRDSRSNGYVIGVNFGDLRKACQYYRLQYVRKRGNLFLTPMPVAYAEVEQNGALTDLLIGLLEATGSPFAQIGPIQDMRDRAIGTLKNLQVQTLIVGYGEGLSYEAFEELVRIVRKLKITLILAGTLYLSEVFSNFLKRRGNRHRDVYNTFLDFHEYTGFDKKETPTLMNSWEEQVLGSEATRLNLADIPDVCDLLFDRCGGQAEPLYESLRKIAIWKLDNPELQFDRGQIATLLASRRIPKSK